MEKISESIHAEDVSGVIKGIYVFECTTRGFFASTSVSAPSDIHLFNGEWRLSLKSHSLGEEFGGRRQIKVYSTA